MKTDSCGVGTRERNEVLSETFVNKDPRVEAQVSCSSCSTFGCMIERWRGREVDGSAPPLKIVRVFH